MGFYEDVTGYFWNWFIYLMATGAITGCWWYGVWGLLFDDDEGALMEECFGWYGGTKVEFPYEYSM
jgi:hypothetical protein